MPEETIMLNGSEVVVVKTMSSGDLLLTSMLTLNISIILGILVLFLMWGRR